MKRPEADQPSTVSGVEEDPLAGDRDREVGAAPSSDADAPSADGEPGGDDPGFEENLDHSGDVEAQVALHQREGVGPADSGPGSSAEGNAADGDEKSEGSASSVEKEKTPRSRTTGLAAHIGRARHLGTAIRAGAARQRRILLVATTSFAVLLLVASVVLHLAVVRPAQQTEQARIDGLAAARNAVEQILTYQPASQDPDLARARSLVTGDFGNQFEMVLNTVVRPALQGGVGTRTAVTRAGVVSADTDRVTALLYLTQEASRSDEPPRTNAGRAEVTVQRVDGRWLVSDLRNF